MNFFKEDAHLHFVLKKYMDQDLLAWAWKELDEFGELCGTEIDERASYTDRDGQPKLIKYDRFGEEVSNVWLNEGYKKTVEQVYGKGIVGYVHKEIPELGRKGNYLYSFAQGYLLSQAEPGFHCPVTLTAATAYLLDKYGSNELKEQYLPHIISTGETELYEGATFLTERQGGSDVGSNETKAIHEGETYCLFGEKYFASNAGACKVAMVLARREGAPKGSKGLSLFLVPWHNEKGELNGIQIRRLKDKLGVRAVPSGEVVFHGAKAFLVGDPNKGLYYMMEALNLSRVCNAVASIGIMKRALVEAKKYAFQRLAFEDYLVNYPMIQETLGKMTVKQEVETSAVFELIHLFDKVTSDSEVVSDDDKVLNRLLIAILKMETAEQAIHFSHEAIEMHGGNGYIEDFVTPRLLRDAQVLTVWEGTANILGLEVLRLMNKFQAHQLFCQQMRNRLHSLPKDYQKMTIPIINAIDDLEELCSFLLTSSMNTQTYHCKRSARQMTKIFESVIALEDAQIGGDRKKMVAELFLEMAWKDPNSIDKDMKFLSYFKELVPFDNRKMECS
jgi:acyl-CoA dehydrogenase